VAWEEGRGQGAGWSLNQVGACHTSQGGAWAEGPHPLGTGSHWRGEKLVRGTFLTPQPGNTEEGREGEIGAAGQFVGAAREMSVTLGKKEGAAEVVIQAVPAVANLADPAVVIPVTAVAAKVEAAAVAAGEAAGVAAAEEAAAVGEAADAAYEEGAFATVDGT